MRDVFVDMSYALGLQTQPCSQSEPGFGCPGALGKSAVQPRSHAATAAEIRPQGFEICPQDKICPQR
jgi:hypothetical protein